MDGANSCQSEGKITPEGLQRIIIARKGKRKERAKHQLRIDRQRIKEMVSTGGTTEPLDIIPSELWEAILNELPPIDKGTISQVHTLFHNLMENTRVRDILFPQILGTTVYEGPPLASKHKVLRGVAKGLKNEIDFYYETHLLKLMGSETEVEYQALNYVPNIVEMYSSRPEKEIPMRLFTRSLCMGWSNSQIQFERHRQNIVEFLEKVGDQIWYLRYRCYDDTYEYSEDPNMSMAQIYIECNNFLAYMPNLKWLRLELWIKAQEQKSIGKTLKNQPPQKLHKLERIDFQSSHRNPEATAIYEAVLLANPHIKTLCTSGLREPISTEVVKSLNLLEALIPSHPALVDIQNLVNYNWQLKRIQISLNAFESSINSLFRFLENFPSLEYVDLGISQIKFENELSYLRLSNLERLDMRVLPHDEACLKQSAANSFFSLQFLIFAVKLKSLSWADRMFCPQKFRRCLEKMNRREGGIDFCGGMTDLSGSKIWDVFPELELVKTECMSENDRLGEITRVYNRRSLVHTKSLCYNCSF